jgi:methyl-accepting chemotaxis protein
MEDNPYVNNLMEKIKVIVDVIVNDLEFNKDLESFVQNGQNVDKVFEYINNLNKAPNDQETFFNQLKDWLNNNKYNVKDLKSNNNNFIEGIAHAVVAKRILFIAGCCKMSMIISILQSNYYNLQQQLTDLQNEAIDQNKRFNDTIELNKNLKSKNDELQENAYKKNADINDLKSINNALKKNANKKNADNNALQENVNKKNAIIKEATESKNVLQSQIKKLQENATNKNEETEETSKQYQELRDIVSALLTTYSSDVTQFVTSKP